jgi:hypothetical protein
MTQAAVFGEFQSGIVDVTKAISLPTPPCNLQQEAVDVHFKRFAKNAENSFSPSLSIIEGWSEPVCGRECTRRSPASLPAHFFNNCLSNRYNFIESPGT